MSFLTVILEALRLLLPWSKEPPDSRVGESEMERKDRNFWWITGWVIFAVTLFIYLIRVFSR